MSDAQHGPLAGRHFPSEAPFAVQFVAEIQNLVPADNHLGGQGGLPGKHLLTHVGRFPRNVFDPEAGMKFHLSEWKPFGKGLEEPVSLYRWSFHGDPEIAGGHLREVHRRNRPAQPERANGLEVLAIVGSLQRPGDLRVPRVESDGQGLRREGFREINVQVQRLVRFGRGQQDNRSEVAVDELGGIETLPLEAIRQLGRTLGHPHALRWGRGKGQHGDILIIVFNRLRLWKCSREALRTLEGSLAPYHHLHG